MVIKAPRTASEAGSAPCWVEMDTDLVTTVGLRTTLKRPLATSLLPVQRLSDGLLVGVPVLMIVV